MSKSSRVRSAQAGLYQLTGMFCLIGFNRFPAKHLDRIKVGRTALRALQEYAPRYMGLKDV
ncbi:MAG: hypothetical protein M1162_01180 [Candidatus Thermoplasmatota archaeon]|nr:hypothetical protein [Candidatus Thermoplasmatota archaeon]